jgi:O-antigen/teichoic acid export membrane protein
MDHELQAGKNIAWGAISQIFLRIFGLAFFVYMTYRLRETGIGQYGFVTSFVLFWFIVSDFGAGGYLYREWSKGDKKIDEVEKDFNIVFTMRFFISLVVFIPFLIINYYINHEVLLPLALFFAVTFFSIFISLADNYLSAINYFKYTTVRTIIEKLTILVVGGILLFFWPRLEMVFIAMLVAQFVSLAYYSFSVLPFKFRLVFNPVRTKELIRKGLPFLLLTFFISIYSRIDMVMLRCMVDFDAVGWYSAAYKFLDTASIVAVGLYLPSVFPILSSLYKEETKIKFIDFFYKSFRIVFSLTLLITIAIIFFSPLLISWFFPETFGPSVLALRILILVLILSALSLLFNNLLFIQNKEKISLYIIIFSACLNIGLNFLLIPKYSLYGAAWATVLAEAVNLFLLQYFAKWERDKKIIIKIIIVVLVNILIMLALKFAGQLNNMFIGVAIILLNISILFKIKLWTMDDIAMFWNPIRNKFNNIFKSEEII